jgi:CRP/FNR family transcriptional regulator
MLAHEIVSDLQHPTSNHSLSLFARPVRPAATPSHLSRFETGTLRRLDAREHVFCEGDPRTHVFQVEEGTIVIYKVLPDGRRQVIGFAYPGDLLGLGTSADHMFNAQATSAAKVRCLGAHALEEAAAHDAALALKLYQAISLELSAARNLLISIGQQSALERVAAFLVALDRKTGVADGSGSMIRLPMRRSDIADFLGLTIETVSRTLTKLRVMQVIEIVNGTEVHLRARARLEQLAGC